MPAADLPVRAGKAARTGPWIASLGLGASLLLAPGCARPPAEPEPAEPPRPFSGERAWEHMEAPTSIGPRVAGTPEADAARDYIRSELEALGLTVHEHAYVVEASAEEPDLEEVLAQAREEEAAAEEDDAAAEGEESEEAEGTPIKHLTGVVPGTSNDIILLAAHFDTPQFEEFTFVGANDGASGPALLLELARVLSESPLPYTTWITFLDGEAMGPTEGSPHAGTGAFAEDLAENGTLERVRVAVFFNQVADADLTIARDLRSHRQYRRKFFEVARQLGHENAFPPSRFSSPEASHIPFLEQRMRRVVAIVDDRFGGNQAPGVYWHTEEDTLEHCSPESLAIVGNVSAHALRDISERLRKIDRFVRAPGAEAAGSVRLVAGPAGDRG